MTTSRRLPTLCVLPFASPASDGALGVIASGLDQDICSELTRFRGLRVIAPTSAALVADLSDEAIAERLEATHVLRARLRRSSQGVLRLVADLSRTRDRAQLWSETIDLPEADPAAVEEGLVARIAATLNARIEDAVLDDARRQSDGSLETYELTLRGLHLLRAGTRNANDEAAALFERALAADPLYARAHAGLSLCWFNQWNCQHWDRFDEASRHAYRHARRALELDDRDAMSHLIIAQVALFNRAWEQAAWYVDRALALCPNDTDILTQAAVLQVYLGQPAAAALNVARAMELNPFHPNDYFAMAAFAEIFSGNLESGLAHWSRCASFPLIDGPAFAAVAEAHLGRSDLARAELARYFAAYGEKIAFGAPFETAGAVAWLFEVNPFRKPEALAFLREGLRLLGTGDPPPAVAAPVGRAPEAPVRLSRGGEGWTAEHGGRRILLPDLKGLHDIRRLIEAAGEEIHCLDLDERIVETPGDALMDEKARNAAKARLRELQADLEEAEDANDIGRAERLREEMDGLIEALSAALGLGGRRRRLGDASEKARTAVTWRIRHALRRIEAADPDLGRYLGARVRTGTFCSFAAS